MTTLAVLSDLHGNLSALEAAEADLVVHLERGRVVEVGRPHR